MIKVGLFNDSFPPLIDGVANATFNYADIITKKYGMACAIVPRYPHVTDNYPFEVYRYSSITQIGKMPYRIGNPFSPANISDMRKKNFDILHVHCPFASAVFARQINMRPKSKKAPMIFTYHTKFDIDLNRYVKNPQFNKVARRFVVNNISSMDDVWVVSEGAGQNLLDLGYKGEYIIMPNGTDFPKGKADPDVINEIKRIYKLTDEFVFLFVGRMMWYKNLKLILDALKIVKDAGIKFKAFFVGDGGDAPAVAKYAKDISINDRTEFVGAVFDRDKLKAYFSVADLLLFPSTYDTSGLVVKEAAACECASILVRNSCASEGVEDGISGLLIDENSDDFAKKIIDACRASGFLQSLGKRASDLIYLSWDDAVKKAVDRYHYVLENYKKRP